jgi:hypothetical protein
MTEAAPEIRAALENQRQLVGRIEQAIAGLDDTRLRQGETPGKWAIIDVIQHLADVERVAAFRLRMILAEPGSTLMRFDQDAWARELDYHGSPVADVLDQLRAARQANVLLLERMPAAALARTGRVGDADVSVGQLIQKYAIHDQIHLNQINRIKKALGAA